MTLETILELEPGESLIEAANRLRDDRDIHRAKAELAEASSTAIRNQNNSLNAELGALRVGRSRESDLASVVKLLADELRKQRLESPTPLESTARELTKARVELDRLRKEREAVERVNDIWLEAAHTISVFWSLGETTEETAHNFAAAVNAELHHQEDRYIEALQTKAEGPGLVRRIKDYIFA